MYVYDAGRMKQAADQIERHLRNFQSSRTRLEELLVSLTNNHWEDELANAYTKSTVRMIRDMIQLENDIQALANFFKNGSEKFKNARENADNLFGR